MVKRDSQSYLDRNLSSADGFRQNDSEKTEVETQNHEFYVSASKSCSDKNYEKALEVEIDDLHPPNVSNEILCDMQHENNLNSIVVVQPLQEKIEVEEEVIQSVSCEFESLNNNEHISNSMNTESKKKDYKGKIKSGQKKLFECKICQKIFNKPSRLKRHQVLHSDNPKPFACTKCSKSFSRLEYLTNHFDAVHAEHCPFKCSTCQKSFNRNENFKRHEKLCASEGLRASEGLFKCKICKKAFTRARDVTRHQVLHSDNPKPFACTMCNKSFSRLDKFTEHFDAVHAGHRPFKCSTCQKSFNRNEDLKRHKKICSSEREKLFECKICQKIFNKPSRLKRHQVLHSDNPKPFACTKCSKSFSRLENLTNHFDAFHAEHCPFKCSTCQKSFNRNESFKRHEKLCASEGLRASEGLFKCKICKKAFTRARDVTRHQVLHSENPKPFVCATCNKSFSRLDKFTEHFNAVHADHRPLKCSKCQKSFFRNEDLESHTKNCSMARMRRRKDKLFSCDICMRTFSTENHVQEHKAIQHNESEEFSFVYSAEKFIGVTNYKKQCKAHYNTTSKQFLCSKCGDSFTTLHYLMDHIRLHTEEEPYECRYCDKALQDQYTHERSYTGEEPFHCQLCSKSFTTARGLKVHTRIHTGKS